MRMEITQGHSSKVDPTTLGNCVEMEAEGDDQE